MSAAIATARDRLAAIRSLRDCGAVSIDRSNVPSRFRLLIAEGMVKVTRCGNRRWTLALNDEGRRLANIVLKPAGVRAW